MRPLFRIRRPLMGLAFLAVAAILPGRADFIWVEGENPAADRMNRHPWRYDQVNVTADANKGWFPFDPPRDAFGPEAALDLRFLNEKQAGDGGFIAAKDGNFVHASSGEPVRFWAVNGPPAELTGEPLRRCARLLAKRGVNMVRVHGALFDPDGEVDPAKVRHALEVVEAMKAEGIYTHFSIYFPLWFTPKAGHPWLEGYDGRTHPFAALMFNPRFQAKHREWFKALLSTPGPSGRTLAQDPAVFGVEVQNEDSFFFWTFDTKNLPDAQSRLLERMFGEWLAAKYGSVEKALAKWSGARLPRDAPTEGRVAFRPLWSLFNERTARDQDTAAFLVAQQTRFYSENVAYLRGIGFKGLVCASNWTTASPEVLGPLEKLTYTAGDFIDRHGYFSCNHQGDNSAWSLRDGHTWSDRSAYRFDNEKPGQPRSFGHPGIDPHYDKLPSMVSEIAWCRPNRFRGEAPVFLAAYGCLQHSDAIVHFALDGAGWSAKPNFWMQPWTVLSPATMGQFPATALIFRRGLVAPGGVVADARLNKNDLLALKGTPLPQDAALDELRLQDAPKQGAPSAGQRLNPLLHFVGRTQVSFVDGPAAVKTTSASDRIDTAARVVRSTHDQLVLDYARGVLTIDAPAAQGVSGCLASLAAPVETKDLSIASKMETGHILVVSLDGRPLAGSARILLQVMSEEKETGRRTEPVSPGVQRLVSTGGDPWLVRELSGTVRLKWPGAGGLKATPLDLNGYRAGPPVPAASITLQPSTVYYLIEK